MAKWVIFWPLWWSNRLSNYFCAFDVKWVILWSNRPVLTIIK